MKGRVLQKDVQAKATTRAAIEKMKVEAENAKNETNKNYKKLSLKYHPDRNGGEFEAFQLIADLHDQSVKEFRDLGDYLDRQSKFVSV